MSYPELITSISELKSAVSAKARAQSATLKTINSVLTALKDPSKNAFTLIELTEKLRKSDRSAVTEDRYERVISALDEASRNEVNNVQFLFARDLRSVFEAEGIPIKGNPPQFISEPLVIDVDLQSGKVNLKYGHETLNPKPVKLEPEQALSAYHKAKKALTGRKLNLNDFLEILFEAYRRALFQTGGQIGDRVNIVDCYRETVWLKQTPSFKKSPSKQSFSDYTRAYFTYDILQLQKNNLMIYKNYRLRLGTATIEVAGNASRTIWLPRNAEEGSYMMDIYWSREMTQ